EVIVPLFIVISIAFCTPEKILQGITVNTMYFMWSGSLLFLLHYFFFCRYKKFPFVLLCAVMSISFLWNPICIAPHSLDLNISSALVEQEMPYGGKILVVTGDHVRPNLVAASGRKVLNVTSHYVDPEIYSLFYKEVDDGSFNKFNHMIVNVSDGRGKEELRSFGDVIRFELSSNISDFSRFPADYVITHSNKKEMRTNSSLEFLETKNGFSYYRIRH
ncbi:MAG: hypothetical protein RBT16_09140, partial [Desulfococcus multivorans]|nr:hypothetical protein [Desulfococcus multivorans]